MPVDEAFVRRATLGANVVASALGRALARTELSSTEASVRWSGSSGARGNRIMIERAPPDVVDAIAAALACPLPGDARTLVAHASELGMPLIGGWDVEGERIAAKIYANGSDASDDTRERLWRATGWPTRIAGRVPHLVALNVSPDGSLERKAYVQGIGPIGPRAEALARSASALDVVAGFVGAWTLEPSRDPRPRAFFVAVRDADAVRVDALLRTVDGFDADAVDASLPFERGQCRSVGVALDGEPVWTAYFKPRGHGAPLHAIDPVACFAAPDGEVAIFSAPRALGQRAYGYAGEQAISYRVTAGDPDPGSVTRLVRWAIQRLARTRGASGAPTFEHPPEPWKACVVGSLDVDASARPARS